jgi:hypothetical protein
MKPCDDSIWQTRFMSPAARPRLFWQMSAGEPHIPYDGVPFMSVGQNTELPCVRYGGRRKKVETVALATGDLINMDFRQKTGCEAKITVRRVMRFPSARVTDLSQQGVAAVRRMRKQLLEDLTQKIIAGIAKPLERYYFLLPTPLAHSNHTVPEMEVAPSIVQPVADEIVNQLSHGITEIALIRDHIRNFADASFGTEASLHADNPAYYPSEVGVYHHIYWLYKMGQVIDQESAFKAKLGLGDDIASNALSLATTTTPSKVPVTNDTITSVYSIIMDQASGTGATLELGESQLQATQHEVRVQSSPLSFTNCHTLNSLSSQVELKTSTDPVSQADEEFPLPDQNTSPPASTPISVPSISAVSAAAKRGLNPKFMPLTMPPMTHLSNTTPVVPKPETRDTPTSAPSSSLSGVAQAQTEVRDILRIIENQTHACKTLPALNTLRRQLTELCSQFSMHLSGVPTRSFGGVTPVGGANHTPTAKRAKLS